ncbi:GNAT family N-acetyltransferase [Allokutzneria albata]|uniref:Ribosomal protein S18 acetylase RimI n=1 Tax=Allokutzneria albata TaxID=211114 RepID=A0A1H0CYR5_ALLAB|nr:GNAT family N-acetyltransferase [Allokutzneria albata]SDN63047.1 Ribosomal protein S18 acetylase RimI [Allokutzneria albata]
MDIRRAGPDDWEQYRDIRLAALAEAPYAFGSTLAREQPFTETQWRDRLSRGATFLGYLSGTACALASGTSSHELVSVWAAPSARGTGLAAAVVEAVLAWAAPSPMTMWVAEDNTAAIRFYVRLGFSFTGDRAPLPSDPSRHELSMRRSPPASS